MDTAKRWRVDLYIDEHGNTTRARAVLHSPDETGLVGTGEARRNPRDPQVPEIGDELAAARALSELAHRLLDATVADIEQFTDRPVHLSE